MAIEVIAGDEVMFDAGRSVARTSVGIVVTGKGFTVRVMYLTVVRV
jgi:hypothetical protein